MSENKFIRSACMAALLPYICLAITTSTTYAATPPTASKLTLKDTKGTPDTADDTEIKITTGYEAGRVAVDNSGNVYISDPIMNTVYQYNTNWKLIKQFKVNRSFATGVTGSGGVVYISGSLNGAQSIFILKSEDKKVIGNLGVNWQQPADLSVDSSGNIVVVDSGKGIVRQFGPDGVMKKEFGPFGGERYASETLDGTTFSRTRHRMMFPQGVAVDDANNLLYVSIKELVESLSVSDGGGIGYTDTEESWKYYNFDLNVPTDSSYRYWTPVSATSGIKYHVIVVDIGTGAIKKKITVGDGSDLSLKPRGLALDGKGRLYMAAIGGATASGGEIRVYDAETGAQLSVGGGFDAGMYLDLAFHPDSEPDPDPNKAKGRLFATVAGSNIIATYSIDGGTNPANIPPSAPGIISPANKTYVSSLLPVFEVKNATDSNYDPLTYGYELKSSDGTILTSISGIVEGQNGQTSMAGTYPLKENTAYRWRPQSFDGHAAAWSNEAEFCVNLKNDNPEFPTVTGPKDLAPASPFSTLLSWNKSNDPDCYDTVTYTVEISSDPAFATTRATVSGISNQSVRISSISGFESLISGSVYYWRVKGIDNNGAESAYSTGSFTYRTTVVRFESNRIKTQVYIDGNYGYLGRLLGATPTEVQNIPPGSHFVTFVKSGQEPYYTLLNLTDPLIDPLNSTVTVSAIMHATYRMKPSATGTELLKTDTLNSSPFIVDWNNDGLKDMVIGSSDGRISLYLSEEQPQSDGTKKVVLVNKGPIQADGSDINAGSRAVPYVVDYNNDSKKDLLAGNSDGYIYLYLNIGEENAPLLTSAGTIRDKNGDEIKLTNSAPVMIDYNNDGKKDLVVGSSDGSVRLYLNNGTDAAPKFVPSSQLTTADGVTISVGSNSKPFFVDWNSDGKKDLIIGRGVADNEGNTVDLYLNIGSDDSPAFLSNSGLRQWIRENRRERGNREYMPYIGYNYDLGDLTQGNGEAAPFVVNIDGSPAKDLLVGNGAGGIITYISGE